jgi:ABC-type transport system involved in Fe-S cluster assembly fused permease/ATPase subunit
VIERGSNGIETIVRFTILNTLRRSRVPFGGDHRLPVQLTYVAVIAVTVVFYVWFR